MKRLHIHVGVTDLERSVGFYSTLFAAAPVVRKPDYAKWMLEDPRVNFAISSRQGAAKGIEHLGIQTENPGELAQVYGRLHEAGEPVLEEGATTCCYAKSEKSWIADPDGVIWEAFHTNGDAVIYGDSPAFSALSARAADNTVCTPTLPTAPLPAISTAPLPAISTAPLPAISTAPLPARAPTPPPGASCCG